jgi:hypothetical protein
VTVVRVALRLQPPASAAVVQERELHWPSMRQAALRDEHLDDHGRAWQPSSATSKLSVAPGSPPRRLRNIRCRLAALLYDFETIGRAWQPSSSAPKLSVAPGSPPRALRNYRSRLAALLGCFETFGRRSQKSLSPGLGARKSSRQWHGRSSHYLGKPPAWRRTSTACASHAVQSHAGPASSRSRSRSRSRARSRPRRVSSRAQLQPESGTGASTGAGAGRIGFILVHRH